MWSFVSRYGYHVSKTSYVICNDPPTIQKIFSRIRNFEGDGSYPKTCGSVRIVHVRDVTTGYDSSQPDLRSVRLNRFNRCLFYDWNDSSDVMMSCDKLPKLTFINFLWLFFVHFLWFWDANCTSEWISPVAAHLCRCFPCPGAVTWSPSRCRTASWPRCERAAPNQRSNITPSSAPSRGKGQLVSPRFQISQISLLCDIMACGWGFCDFMALSVCSDVSGLEEELRKVTNALLDEFLEPEKNNLICRTA